TMRCGGVYTFWPDYQPKCTHSHGNENVTTALRDSCNVYFYDLGRRLGIESFNETAATLGFGQKTGLEISEAAGNLSSEEYFNAHHKAPERWQKGNVVQAAIGQMDTQVTPVQLATYAASVANKGERLATHLVGSVRSYNFDALISDVQPTVLAQVPGDKATVDAAFATVEQGMLLASKTGTATQFLGDYIYNIASKTGTSQNAKGFFDATIVAYGPVENPELAIGAVVESAGNGYQLARMVRDVFDEYYAGKNQNTTLSQAGVLLQ
ncbi:MAG: penicillin-binding transpeptidase domain-containing protein, partial [Pygmaiobacter sp.]